MRACVAAVAVAAIAVIANVSPASGSSGGVGSTGGGQVADERGQSAGAKYDRLWQKTSAAERRWASRTSECESGGNPNAIGGGGIYRGAFQFLRSTWAVAPKSPGGDPIAHPYRTQAVVAVMLMRQEGTSPWPVCG